MTRIPAVANRSRPTLPLQSSVPFPVLAMNSISRCLGLVILLGSPISSGGGVAAADERSEAEKATISRGFELARKFCGRCHGEGTSQGNAQFSIIDPEGMIKSREKYVVPGNADES